MTGLKAESQPALAVVVVRYKKPLLEIPFIRILRAGKADSVVEAVVVDNSPTPVTSDELNKLPASVHYEWLGGNRGLSKAYNIARARLCGEWTHVCFLDQDTEGLEALLAELAQGILADITLPTVRAGGTLISPCRRTGPWYHPLASTENLPSHISWINSGMTLARSTAEQFPFDEKLFLDYVDHRFAADVLDAGTSVDIRRHVVLLQDYSRTTDDADQALERFKLFQKDVSVFYGRRLSTRLYASVLTLRRALGAALSYRRISFISQWLLGRRQFNGAER